MAKKVENGSIGERMVNLAKTVADLLELVRKGPPTHAKALDAIEAKVAEIREEVQNAYPPLSEEQQREIDQALTS